MAHRLGNFVRQTSTSTGFGPFVLTGSAAPPYRSFASLLSDGDTTEVTIVNPASTQWQVSVCSFAAGVLTVDADHFFASSTGSPVNFDGGTKNVLIGPIAERGRPFLRSADFTALPLVYNVDTASGDVTAALIDDPEEGDTFVFNDYAGTWPLNRFLLDGNGNQFDDGTGILKDRITCAQTGRFAAIFADGVFTIR